MIMIPQKMVTSKDVIAASVLGWYERIEIQNGLVCKMHLSL
jgi:hypothetical protein